MTAVMTNKEITPKSGASLPQGWQASSSDEIDLRNLVLLLWQQKLLILIITVLFAVCCYFFHDIDFENERYTQYI